MKTIFTKFYIIVFMLFSNFLLFAQPGMNNDGGDLEGNDTPPTPINGKIIWLAILGVIFIAFSTRKSFKKIN